MMMATQSSTVARSVVKTYLVLLVAFSTLGCCCGAAGLNGDLVFLLRPGDGPDPYMMMGTVTGLLTNIHLFVTWLFLAVAVTKLDRQRGDDPPPAVFDIDSDQASGKRGWDLPPVSDDALLWKERFVGRTPVGASAVSLLPIAVCFMVGLVSVLLVFEGPDRSLARERNHVVFGAVALICFSVYVLLVAYRIAGAIVLERERHTLEPLLTMPITPLELIHAKTTGALARHSAWLTPFGMAWLIFVGLSVNKFASVLLLLPLLIHLAFFMAVGLFLSVVCRTSVAAYVSLTLVLAVLVIGTAIAPRLLDSWNDVCWLMNPVACWIAVADARTGRPIIEHLALYSVAASVLWGIARLRFARNTA
jgi:hypothetical protein